MDCSATLCHCLGTTGDRTSSYSTFWVRLHPFFMECLISSESETEPCSVFPCHCRWSGGNLGHPNSKYAQLSSTQSLNHDIRRCRHLMYYRHTLDTIIDVHRCGSLDRILEGSDNGSGHSGAHASVIQRVVLHHCASPAFLRAHHPAQMLVLLCC
jgi:hypothetical protein